MEEVGSNPPHRFGRARIYGQRLNSLLQRQARSRAATRHSSPAATAYLDPQALLNPSNQGSTPNPFQPSGNANTFFAAPPMAAAANHTNVPSAGPSQEYLSAFQFPDGQQTALNFDNPLEFNNYSLSKSNNEFDLAGLSEDRLNELFPSSSWLPVGTDDLMDIAAQFGHQVRDGVHTRPCRANACI